MLPSPTSRRTLRSSNSGTNLPISTLILYFLIIYLYIYILLIQQASLTQDVVAQLSKDYLHHRTKTALSHHGQRSQDFYASQKYQDLNKRLQRLETKIDTYLAFNTDPFLSTRTSVQCKNKTKLKEYCPLILGENYREIDCNLAQYICLDDFPYQNCTVYDFGIREEPEFGLILAGPPFNCHVYAFDPSPITQKWYQSERAKTVRDNPNYKLYHYGGWSEDGTITLRAYDWGQVSIYQFPDRVINPHNCSSNKQCRYNRFDVQKTHALPVRSVDSIMRELGHDYVDVLKIDVEGAEWKMLENLIDSQTCQRIHQMTLEWHHYDFDLRYGASSVPHMNVLVQLLQKECGLHQFWIHDPIGWPSNELIYHEMHLTLRYNLASFM
jgi:FkbM family methyltransferase